MNNEPAFPTNAEGIEPNGGMSLRDYFAVHATDEDIAPYLNDYSKMNHTPAVSNSMVSRPATASPTPRSRQQARYMFADAMLKQRIKHEQT